MKIKKLQIKNFKSLVDFELEDLKPFCAFVGPNASGKSNIFEALEFTNYLIRYGFEAPGFFGGVSNLYSFNAVRPLLTDLSAGNADVFYLNYDFEDTLKISAALHLSVDMNTLVALSSGGSTVGGKGFLGLTQIRDKNERNLFIKEWLASGARYDNDYEQFVDNFSRLFIGDSRINKSPVVNGKLLGDGKNLAQVIGKIFEVEETRNDFIEWLQILIPEFKGIEVKKSNIDGSYDFFISEKASNKPFPRQLISDGTYNLLALIAAVYQTDQPQFICIEEPENGLHPQAIQLLVDFFREKCEENGHHIWLNTHSQTLVRHLEIEEVVLVNKVNGSTKARQLTKEYNVDIRTDEAWLTNALGGGVL